MSIFRTHENTPLVYPNESRDFQLFGKSLDLIANMVNADATSIKYIVDTDTCRNTILPLLQTRLGFFSELNLDYDTLRRLLSVFAMMVKNKGSKKALKWCINSYFKIFDIDASIAIMYFDEDDEQYGEKISKNTVLIGVSSMSNDVIYLQEFFKYIVPAGVKTKLLVFSEFSEIQEYVSSDSVEMLFVSTDINAALRGSTYPKAMVDASMTFDAFENKMVADVDTLEIIGSRDSQDENRPTLEHDTIEDEE